jgi:Leu/Phe-tRNA-protein transferase
MDNKNVNLNLRVNSEFREAVNSCAESIGEKPATFIRKAIVNRLTEEGIYTQTLGGAESWSQKDE